MHLAAEGLRIRLRGDDTHRAAHRLSPIQGLSLIHISPKAPGGERGRLDLTHPQADALRLTAVVLRRAAQLGAAVV